ncbi:hypothetical protein N5D63_06035 [Comamonas thiooxydans]|uniref:TspB protein n=1 Tax=Comamonas thiooxydans TaxID=363952 RepID=A0AA42TSX9_9BURK|nr:hypothetical protein [Comamonas thiooxydans]MDH1333705.1 hypothetical protein [Comamonas thiooxydans]MDH1739223.1 hypothetical protein [Comamonas thiooxydans]
MKKLFVGALLASSVLPAFAAISLVNYDGFVVVQSGNTWNFHHESPENTALKGGTVYGRAGSAVDTVEPLTVKSRDVVRVGKGAVVDVVAKVPRANMARALIAAAKIGRVAAGPVAYLATEALLDYGLKNIKVGPDGALQADAESQKDYPQSDGNYWAYNNDDAYKELTKEAACERVRESDFVSFTVRMVEAGFAYCDWKTNYGTVTERPIFRRSSSACPSGYYVDNGICTPGKPVSTMTEQDLQDWIAARDGWPTSSAIALQAMLTYPDTRKILTPYPDNGVTLIGPPFVEGKTSTNTDTVQLVPGTNTVASPGATSTQTGTRTSTTTTTHPLTYSGNSVKSSTVTNTTTNITNNTTNITTTETKTEKVEDDSEEQSPTDAPLGDVPKLYEKKYPDGLLGVWDAKKAEFEQTSFFRMIDELTPKIGQAGSCPSWSIDLSWTPGGSMGVHQLQPPCMIWPILKAIVIISALFLARALIFGG